MAIASLQLRQQQANQQRLMQLHALRQQQQQGRRQQFSALADIALSTEADIKKLAPALGVDASTLQALEELQKVGAKRRKAAEQQGQIPQMADVASQARTPQERTTASNLIQPIAGNATALNQLAGEIQLRQQAAATQQEPRTLFERLAQKAQNGTATPIELARLQTMTAGEGMEIQFDDQGRLRMVRTGNLGGLTGLQQLDLVQEAQRVDAARGLVRNMLSTVESDPEGLSGLAVRLQNLADTGLGIGESLNAVFGPGTGETFLRMGRDAFQRRSTENPELKKRYGRILTRGADVAELEVDQTLLAFALADLNRGSGRLPVKFVEDFKKLLNFKDLRGSRSLLKRLSRIEEILGEHRADISERAGRAGVDLPKLREPSPRGAPDSSQAPETAPRRFRVGPNGEFIEVR